MAFSVILNGCNVTKKQPTEDIRQKLGIRNDDFVFACVGNINPNKNQKQIVDAFSILDNPDGRLKVIFVGGGDANQLKDYIQHKKLSDVMAVVGSVPKEEIHNYYIASDATVLASLSEGFGLSIIEGYVYGKPTVVFSDLPSYIDITDPKTSVGVTDRSTQSLAAGLLDCALRQWDKEYISDYSARFALKIMAEKYHSALNKAKKILEITPYIYSDRHQSFKRNRTGFGLMVNDIAEKLGEMADVRLFTVNAVVPEIEMQSYRTICRSWGSFVQHFSLRSLKDALIFLSNHKVPVKERMRIIYQFLSIGEIEKNFSKYDMVHIHGCSPITAAAIKACQRTHTPFLITLHGLVSFEKEVRLHPSLKQYEKEFLKEAYINDYNLSFISTGNKKTVEEFVNS